MDHGQTIGAKGAAAEGMYKANKELHDTKTGADDTGTNDIRDVFRERAEKRKEAPKARKNTSVGQSAVRPNNDDREHNTPLSPRGVRVVQPTVGARHEFGEAGGGHDAFSQRMANGDYGSSVVRTDGGAYKYVDKADDHEHYLEMLHVGGAPAVTGETRVTMI